LILRLTGRPTSQEHDIAVRVVRVYRAGDITALKNTLVRAGE
jgi:hypothetical protein